VRSLLRFLFPSWPTPMRKRNPEYDLIAATGAMIGMGLTVVAAVLLIPGRDMTVLAPFVTPLLAVAGALMVALSLENYKRRLDQDQTRDVIRDVVVELSESLGEAAKPLLDEGDLDARKLPLLRALEQLIATIDLIEVLRAELKITDVRLWRQLRALESELVAQRGMMERERRLLEGDRATAKVLAITHEKLSYAAEALEPALAAVRRRLDA
jgi:phosphate/sulfate permease